MIWTIFISTLSFMACVVSFIWMARSWLEVIMGRYPSTGVRTVRLVTVAIVSTVVFASTFTLTIAQPLIGSGVEIW